jgi:flagellar biosynthesis/type III secretory pathway M-ring protein FliF/YscJ
MRENPQGKTSTGAITGLIVGLVLLLVIAALVLFIVLARRRKGEEDLEISAEGNELTFETERQTDTEIILSYEDDFSAAGSQYGNTSEFETAFDDPVADFQGDGGEEGLFGF